MAEAKEVKEQLMVLVNQSPSKMTIFGKDVSPGKSFELPETQALSVLKHYKHIVDAKSIVADSTELVDLRVENAVLKVQVATMAKDLAELQELLGTDAPPAKPAVAGGTGPKK